MKILSFLITFFMMATLTSRAANLKVFPLVGGTEEKINFLLTGGSGEEVEVSYCWSGNHTDCQPNKIVKIKLPQTGKLIIRAKFESGFYRFRLSSGAVWPLYIHPYFKDECFEGQVNFIPEDEIDQNLGVLMTLGNNRQLGCFLSCQETDARCQHLAKKAVAEWSKKEPIGTFMTIFAGEINSPATELLKKLDDSAGSGLILPAEKVFLHTDPLPTAVTNNDGFDTIVVRRKDEKVAKIFRELNKVFWGFVTDDPLQSNPYSYKYGLDALFSAIKLKGRVENKKEYFLAKKVGEYLEKKEQVYLTPGEMDWLAYIISLPAIPEYSFRENPLSFSAEEADYQSAFFADLLLPSGEVNKNSTLFRRELYCSLQPVEFIIVAQAFLHGQLDGNAARFPTQGGGEFAINLSQKFFSPGDSLTFFVKEMDWEIIFSDIHWGYRQKRKAESILRQGELIMKNKNPGTIALLSWDEIIERGLAFARLLGWDDLRREAQPKVIEFSIFHGAVERRWSAEKIPPGKNRAELKSLLNKIFKFK